MSRTKKRLERIENKITAKRVSKRSAIVIYNPNIPFKLTAKEIGAENLIILPDNGTNKAVDCKNSYTIIWN